MFVGPLEVTASDPANGLGGFAAAQIRGDGETVSVVVTLEPAGTLRGTVFESDGSTPAPGVTVRLSPTGQEAVSDGAGDYAFPDLPLRTYNLVALAPGEVVRTRASATVDTAGGTTVQDLILNGVGALTVRVLDFEGAPVPFANVQVFESTFGGRQSGITDVLGERRFENLLAGFNLDVSAMDPETEALFNEYYLLLARKKPNAKQKRRIAELKEELKDRRHLGSTPRDEIMYEVIDRHRPVSNRHDMVIP